MVCRRGAGPNSQRNCSRKCIWWFEKKHTQAYACKMVDSVQQSYPPRQGYREKWMVQICDNQSDWRKYLQQRSIWKQDYIRFIFLWAWFEEEKVWFFFSLCQSLLVNLCQTLLVICKQHFFRHEFCSNVQLHWIESLKINSSCRIKQHYV